MQVPIATLHSVPIGSLTYAMDKDFGTALSWHIKEHGTAVAELARTSGVSRDIINKLLGKGRGVTSTPSTAVENAILLAAYYGKTVEQFINCDDGQSVARLNRLAEMLEPAEAEMLEAQVAGILQKRGVQVTE